MAEIGAIVGSVGAEVVAGSDLAVAPVSAVAPVAADVHEDHSAEQPGVEDNRQRDHAGHDEAANDQRAKESWQQPSGPGCG
ncbi:MAG: hypothetical protein HYX55_00025 [Chloroflexi bacterium]|nr:hypothetical protein [Chloroflexota bacterium]